jgi:hypothetical protein
MLDSPSSQIRFDLSGIDLSHLVPEMASSPPCSDTEPGSDAGQVPAAPGVAATPDPDASSAPTTPDVNSSSDDTGSVVALKERLTFLGEAFSAAKKKKNKKQNLNSRPTVYEPQIRI